MELIDEAGVAAKELVVLDGEGFETLVVVIKASFDLARLDGGVPALAELHEPITLADQYAGEPQSSSLVVAADGALFKPAADILLRGHAVPTHRDQRWSEVALECGTLSKRAAVCGPRLWKRGLLTGTVPGEPGPMERVPLVWERTFGGTDPNTDPPRRFDANPAGNGYRTTAVSELRGQPAPQIEHPDAPVEAAGTKGRAIGFGPVAPFWSERARFAGTYDEAWMKARMPLLPKDFDPRFHQVAPPDQVLAGYVKGGERVRVKGVTREGQLEFVVPRWRPAVSVRLGDEPQSLELACDTLLIDGDARKVSLTFRGHVRVHGRLDQLRWTIVSEAKRG